MAKISAGLLMYKVVLNEPVYFLVHPGGPYFKNKQAGYWTIPKGAPQKNEPLLEAAKREFFEETGIRPEPPYITLESIQQKGGKTVHAWAFEGDWAASKGISSNHFEIEWPPRSGKRQHFPEIDEAQWVNESNAMLLINEAQQAFIKRLKTILSDA